MPELTEEEKQTVLVATAYAVRRVADSQFTSVRPKA